MHFIEDPVSRTLPAIAIPTRDYQRLTQLAAGLETKAPQLHDYLTQELDRAAVVSEGDCGPDVVRVGSLVAYNDGLGEGVRTVRLVWPHEADLSRNRISVLSLIGAALLGMRPGQAIDWPSPMGGFRVLTVMSVDNGTQEPAA